MLLRISPARPAGRVAAALRCRFGGTLRVARLSTARQRNCLSVAVKPEVTSKQVVVDAVTKALKRSASGEYAAAVILASKSLGGWLQDATFVSQLLEPLGQGQEAGELSVLSAAVDAIPRLSSQGVYSSSEGLAILYGGLEETLPGLWAEGSGSSGKGSQPSLEFRVAPLQHDQRPLQVTVPVANTIFNNGRVHTILSSRWRTAKGSAPELLDVAERTRPVIVTDGVAAASSSVVAPLVPVTEPRKILAGLGNILRQVEVDSLPAPASKELEDIIPKLLKARSRRAVGYRQVGPMGVWALIYPQHVAASSELPPALDLGAEDEWVPARHVSGLVSGLLAEGCHIRKILSGGGGWGLKQGLLSLDPQTKYSTADNEDVESFMRSFQGEDSGSATVMPGSYVQYFVEPFGSLPEGLQNKTKIDGESIVLGNQGAPLKEATSSNVEVQPGLFGAASSEGIYIASEADDQHGIITKLDSGGSHIVSRA
ncbi:hypothetical protein QBC34DRAFT_409639 [Podospora aff. communis PSN243]|uniref:FIST domain-containing protein n=1 Tax=Podospora aff. communis PSN243 TaxID=3040156 RepID=A0AAV9GJH3_9PEZI|nr:hypothetical protein QBC34DRAFT_409639 [Podospora aff. communis PSN243]